MRFAGRRPGACCGAATPIAAPLSDAPRALLVPCPPVVRRRRMLAMIGRQGRAGPVSG